MRIPITGAVGFIGSTPVDYLLDGGDEVVGVDNFDPCYSESQKRSDLTGASINPRFRPAEVDILDVDRVEALVLKVRPEALVRLAARAVVRPSIDGPSLYASTDLVGTTNLLEAARRLDPLPRFVYASSPSVYGDRPTAPFRGSDPVDSPMFLDDIVDGVAWAVDRCTGHHIYNPGHSEPIELRAMIEALGEAPGKAPAIRRMPEQPGDVRLTCADITLASAELGYEPATAFRDGIRRFAEWYRSATT